ncbi:checkpoint serine/threonine-protein kinase [Podospora fimiseda]|uniref:Checkpoint serine/threonine-protein kinase n=1 Tax=Podospora fimiseda TaxID=252190 RepID=A0AAN7BVU4_9PEZI|nr:checkpoint serine/threonine-protein kinase [Podospora fimiseda]
MAPNDDNLVDFDIIEGHKENIQALPSGRSAKALAQLFSPSPLQPQTTPTSLDTKDVHAAVRAEFEAEISAAATDSDDPLDVWDRYVRWTLDAYPSAQATAQSQLHTTLERATKAFVGVERYMNDARYLRLWMLYVQFFAEEKREVFLFLSRQGIGEGLAGFYEEYASYLEGMGKWALAEEVWRLGIERGAEPRARLARKFGEFERRRAEKGEEAQGGDNGESAFPVARPALAVRVDPFVAALGGQDPQAARGVSTQAKKPVKSKLAIFSDADAEAAPKQSAMSSRGLGSKGWDSIGSMADRKKENVMEAKPWAGETLKAGGGNKAGGAKLAVFRDPVTVNPSNGKRERVFVDLRAVYPFPDEPGAELSFEEIWAANRGWLGQEWNDEVDVSMADASFSPSVQDENAMSVLADRVSQKLTVHQGDVIRLDENGAPIYPKESKPKKKKKQELNETQIIKAKLDSPSRPKIKKRQSIAEPTMTLHTKAATDDIYDIFNAPLQQPTGIDDGSRDEFGYESDDYTCGVDATRNVDDEDDEEGDEDEDEDEDEADETAEGGEDDAKSVASDWSDFSTRRHIPGVAEEDLMDIHHEDENEPPRTRTIFVPIPPEDYVPTRRPYRDPVEAANNRLPFMTPITERTEISLDVTLHQHKTPSRRQQHDRSVIEEESDDEEEPLSSPLREVVAENEVPRGAGGKMPQPVLLQKGGRQVLGAKTTTTPLARTALGLKGPIIKDLQCNPVDEGVRRDILSNISPPITSYEGFYDHRSERSERGGEIRRYTKSVGRGGGNRSSTDGLGTSAVTLKFPGTRREYAVRKELGAGAFAPVYLVENSCPTTNEEEHENDPRMMGRGVFASAHSRRYPREALKMEDPPTPWEFYMMRLAHKRLGPQHRATASLSPAFEMHLYQDEGFLFLPFYPHGTLLDVVNLFRGEQSSGVMDEQLAMFFAVELLRTVEGLHSKGICHGDIKADNCLLRLPEEGQSVLSASWNPAGLGGWAERGVTLIDFGRGIDMKAFREDVSFIADWKTSAQDCAEMREGRPWTWQIDYHGLAGTIHCLLFGKYIETVRCDQGGIASAGGRRYKIRESLKRYWQTEIWGECFDLLLNPGQFAVGGEDGGKMPVLRGMKSVREKMEMWLEGNCERGVGLRGLMGKVEVWTRGRRK